MLVLKEGSRLLVLLILLNVVLQISFAAVNTISVDDEISGRDVRYKGNIISIASFIMVWWFLSCVCVL
jgi:hypothetical protein